MVVYKLAMRKVETPNPMGKRFFDGCRPPVLLGPSAGARNASMFRFGLGAPLDHNPPRFPRFWSEDGTRTL